MDVRESFFRVNGRKLSPGKRRLRLKCDGTRAETRFRLSAKQTSPFKSAGASILSTAGSRGVPISGSNAGYTMFRGSVKSTGYPLHSPVSPSLPLPCGAVCHHTSTGLYCQLQRRRVLADSTVYLYWHAGDGWTNSCGPLAKRYWARTPATLGGNPVTMSLCSRQFPGELAWDWTRSTALCGRILRTWAMTRPWWS